jgi:hypothetical protein
MAHTLSTTDIGRKKVLAPNPARRTQERLQVYRPKPVVVFERPRPTATVNPFRVRPGNGNPGYGLSSVLAIKKHLEGLLIFRYRRLLALFTDSPVKGRPEIDP